ncbi:SMI1/KNR4 family protein [Solirubrobacter taibaiensis]|nr:SMI1/KNR4 family protein [Solirubrobacter taibaiensis]
MVKDTIRFELLKPRFWSPGGSSSQTFAPLTRAAVHRAERVLEVRLPREYLELLEVQNGGSVDDAFDAFPSERATSWADDHVPFDTLAGIGPHDSWPSVTASGLPGFPAGTVHLCGDGHFNVVLDYREGDIPTVGWLDLECGEDFTLAPDFRTFIEGLVPVASFPQEELEPIFHIERPGKNATYCGFDLSANLDWVAEADITPALLTCPNCERLQAEWAEVARRKAQDAQ